MSLKMPEPVAHIYPSTLERFQERETFDHCYSVKVGCPDETSVEVYTADALRDVLEQAALIAEGYPKHGEATAEEIRDLKDSIK